MHVMRAALGDVLHIDYATRTLVCHGGDLVRDLDLADGDWEELSPGQWRASPRAWAAYARAAYGVNGAKPIMSWEEAASVLGVASSTIRRRRHAAGDQTSPPWRSPDAVRTWWRDLIAPTASSKRRRPGQRKPTTLDDLLAKQGR